MLLEYEKVFPLTFTTISEFGALGQGLQDGTKATRVQIQSGVYTNKTKPLSSEKGGDGAYFKLDQKPSAKSPCFSP